MPRTNPVPERERQICARLREFRLSTKMPQASFARELGVEVDRLASYEYGRVPLRYDLVKRVAEQFGLNQMWLAEGGDSMRPSHPVAGSVERLIPPGCLFSVAYEKHLKKALAMRKRLLDAGMKAAIQVRFLTPLGLPPDQMEEWAGKDVISEVIKKLPRVLHLPYVSAIAAASEDFLQKHRKEVEAHHRSKPKGAA